MTKSFRLKALLLTSSGLAFTFGFTMAAVSQTAPKSGVSAPYDLPGEYAPKGLPLGAFRLFPYLQTAFDYDDNVYFVNTNPKGDTFWEIAPRVALESQWAQNYLVLRAGGTGYLYDTLTHENRIDWDVDGEGRIDIQRGYALFGGVSYRHSYEPRSSPDQLNIAYKSTPFNTTHADARFEAKPEDFGVVVGINFDRYQYDPTQLTRLLELPNVDRDYDEVDGFARLSYDFSPGYSIYGHFAYVTRYFDVHPDRNGVDRDSTGYRANLGLDMEITRLITGEFYVGYLEQDYKAPLGHDGGVNFGADIKWIPTPLLTVRFGASHLINETVVAYPVGIATDSNEERVNLGADYAIRRNILLHVDGAYLRDKFTGSGRLDDVTLLSVGGTYLMNEYMRWDISYTSNHRNSNEPGQNFQDNVFRLALGLQL